MTNPDKTPQALLRIALLSLSLALAGTQSIWAIGKNDEADEDKPRGPAKEKSLKASDKDASIRDKDKEKKGAGSSVKKKAVTAAGAAAATGIATKKLKSGVKGD